MYLVALRVQRCDLLMASQRRHCCPGITRRSFLADTGMGFTGLAVVAMLFRNGIARAEPNAPGWRPPDGKPHFPSKAKSVIWIFLCGGGSHLARFDVKPELNKYAGKSIEDTPHKAEIQQKKGKTNIDDGNTDPGN